jgi:hypothetical protein
MKSTSRVPVNVTIHPQQVFRLDGIVESLQKKGFQVRERLKTIGVVTGECDAGDLAALRSVNGVSSIEHDKEASVGPPDAAVQ